LELDYPILSDPDKDVARSYGVLNGDYAARHTIYIDIDGKIAYVDSKVSPSTAGSDVASRLAELGVKEAE